MIDLFLLSISINRCDRTPQDGRMRTISSGEVSVYKSQSHRSSEKPFLITLQHPFNANQDPLHRHLVRRNERYPYLVVKSGTHDTQSDSMMIGVSGRVILVQKLSQNT